MIKWDDEKGLELREKIKDICNAYPKITIRQLAEKFGTTYHQMEKGVQRYKLRQKVLVSYEQNNEESHIGFRGNVKTSMTLKEYKYDKEEIRDTILTFGCYHSPFNHEDAPKFLDALNTKYKPDVVVNLGDEADNHAISFHDADPDLFSPGDELERAKKNLNCLFQIFTKPHVFNCHSNHGSLVYRKQKHHGLSRAFFRDWDEILEAPKNWTWHFDVSLKTALQYVNFNHGMSTTPGNYSQKLGICTAEAHYHEKFDIFYWGNPIALNWGMHVGCLVDDASYAMAYNKTNTKRPVLGASIIKNGQPILKPMVLKRGGRWIGKI
jgi:hypothetical protein